MSHALVRPTCHAESLPKQIRTTTGPRRDYLHARLLVKRSAHAVMLPAASASCPPGHTRTRSTNARTMAGVTVIWRAAVPFGRSPVTNRVSNFSHYELIRAGNVTGSLGQTWMSGDYDLDAPMT